MEKDSGTDALPQRDKLLNGICSVTDQSEAPQFSASK